MPWFLDNDTTPAIITAQAHIASGHGSADAPTLPGACVLFALGMGMPHVRASYPTTTLTEHLPCFITDTPCVAIDTLPGICLANSGYGAPCAVDTLETLAALGVHTLIVVGMCGGFDRALRVGDVVIPTRIKSEEGTSRHYVKDAACATPDERLHRLAEAHFAPAFAVHTQPTVTTDAVYRQTFAKEAAWRAEGCIGVDMESSALLTVARTKGIAAVTLLIVSDVHPHAPNEPAWQWGDPHFREKRRTFVDHSIAFAASVAT